MTSWRDRNAHIISSSVVCRSVCHDREPYKNRWTNWDAVCNVDSGGPKEARVRWVFTLAHPGEHDWIVHVRRRCGLLSNYFDYLILRSWPVLSNDVRPHKQCLCSVLLFHGQVTIIFVVPVCLSVCAEFFSAVFDPISIKLGHVLYV